MEARSRTNDWRYAHVGEMMWGFFLVTCHLNPQEYIRLWHDHQGKLVAYAILGEDPSFDCQVLPEYEWSGIEAEAMAWAESRIDELRNRDAQRWSGHIVSGARQDDEKRIAFLEQHGFRYSGEFAEVNMLRPLDESIPETVVPPGCQVRGTRRERRNFEPRRSRARCMAAVDRRQCQRRRLRAPDAAARLPSRTRCGCRRSGWRHRRLRELLDRPGQPDR